MSETSTPRDDPFTILFDYIWRGIDEHVPLDDLVKAGNRIRRDGSPRADRKRSQDADLPELNIVPLGIPEPQVWGSSSGALWVQGVGFMLATGTRDETAELFPITWEVMRAIYRMFTARSDDAGGGDGSLRRLKFVKRVQVISVDQLPEPDETRGREGWVALLTMRVEMNFDRKLHLEPDLPRMV